jgi:AraC-like DNA-binding protein
VSVTAPVRFSTAGLPEARKVALWEDHNAHALIGLRCHPRADSSLDATELNLQLDHIHLARVRGNAHAVERPASVIRTGPADAIAVYLTLAGEAFFACDDRTLTLRPGQMLICDADLPFRRGFDGGLEELAVKVPRAVFRELTGRETLPKPLVRDFGRGGPAARTLARMLDRAVRTRNRVEPDETVALQLIAGLAGGGCKADPAAVHRANARVFIEDHLTDSGLSAARVAAGIGISERHLSRAFAGTGLPQYVLARRLELAHAMLTAEPQTPVGTIAARCGFGSAAHFAQVFRARYGMRATDLRALSRFRHVGAEALPVATGTRPD